MCLNVKRESYTELFEAEKGQANGKSKQVMRRAVLA